jgi:hypothetical protein
VQDDDGHAPRAYEPQGPLLASRGRLRVAEHGKRRMKGGAGSLLFGAARARLKRVRPFEARGLRGVLPADYVQRRVVKSAGGSGGYLTFVRVDVYDTGLACVERRAP